MGEPQAAHARMLVPVFVDRPAILQHRNGSVYLSLHDAFYRDQKAAWKRQLKARHPDVQRVTVSRYVLNGQVVTRRRVYRFGVHSQQTRRLVQAYRRWLERERAWYAQYGLKPPA